MAASRVYDPDDPRRCKKSTGKEQCWNQTVPGSDYCSAHGGTSRGLSRDKRMYLLSKAAERARLAQLAEHEQIKSLREEIAIVRMMVELRFDAIQNENDLISAFGPLTQAALTIEELVKTCHQLEESLGSLLSKSSLIKLGEAISRIIIQELNDVANYEEIVDRINERVIEAIATATNKDADD